MLCKEGVHGCRYMYCGAVQEYDSIEKVRGLVGAGSMRRLRCQPQHLASLGEWKKCL